MSVITSVIDSLSNFLKQIDGLGWSSLGKLAGTIAIVGVSMFVWENRALMSDKALQTVAEEIASRPLPVPSDETKDLVRNTFKRNPLVVAVEFISIDFANGSQRTIYIQSDDEFGKAHDSLYERRDRFQRLFVPGQETENNKLVAVLNSEFICLPTVLGDAKVVCAISIPPTSSKTRGYVQLFLNRQPVAEEIRAMRRDVSIISTTYYDTDVRG